MQDLGDVSEIFTWLQMGVFLSRHACHALQELTEVEAALSLLGAQAD